MCSSQQIEAIQEAASLNRFCVSCKAVSCPSISSLMLTVLMSVAADRGNLFSIEKRCKWRGISTQVEQIFVKQAPDFTKYDLILFHGGADREMELASHDIQAKASSLIEAAESNTVFLSVCAGFQLLGHYYKPFQGPELKGVG